jgi:hypothetical protein
MNNITDSPRELTELNKGYQPRISLVKEKCDVQLVYFHNIRKNYFSQLLNVCNASNVRQIETHTPEPRPFYVETAIAKSKKHKSPGSDQILAELIKMTGKYVLRSINSLILFGIRTNCLSSGRSPMVYMMGNGTD